MFNLVHHALSYITSHSIFFSKFTSLTKMTLTPKYGYTKRGYSAVGYTSEDYDAYWITNGDEFEMLCEIEGKKIILEKL